jgi:molybdate transport system substrate-binding protein
VTSRLPTFLAAAVAIALSASCGSETEGSGSATATLTVLTDSVLETPAQQLAAAFEDANPGVRLELVVGPTLELAERLRGGEEADLFIGNRHELDQLHAEGVIEGPSLLLGSDVVQIAVPEGNPAEVTGLDAFLGASPVRAAICIENTTCGAAARAIFSQALPDAAPDRTDVPPVSLLLELGGRTLDAGILWRSQVAGAPQPLDSVPLPREYDMRKDFTIAAIQDDETVERAVHWLATDPASTTLLADRGLRSPVEDSGS